MIIILLAVLTFSLFDYIGFNLLAVKKNKRVLYRIIQTALQIILCVLLFRMDWSYAVGFMLLWWTWLCDWTYYFIDYLSEKILGNSFEGGDSLIEVATGKMTVSWAWWTPVGLITGRRYLTNSVLIYQSLAGIALVLALKIFCS